MGSDEFYQIGRLGLDWIDFTAFLLVCYVDLLGFHWGLLSFTTFHWILHGFTWFLPGLTGFYRVLPGFTRLY